MELATKTTVLLPRAMHQRLTALAKSRHTSLGDLVRTACERQYCLYDSDDALSAVQYLAEMSLPVSDVASMVAESVPPAKDLPT